MNPVQNRIPKIKINLATRSYSMSVVPYLVAAVLVVFSVALSVYNVFDYGVNLHRVASVEKAIAGLGDGAVKLQQTHSITDLTRERLKDIRTEVEFINGIIAEETFSWTALLTALEATLPKNVSIVQLTPEFADGIVTIAAMARSKEDVLEFVDALVGSKVFGEVFLLSHSEGDRVKGSSSGRSRGRERVFFEVSTLYLRGA